MKWTMKRRSSAVNGSEKDARAGGLSSARSASGATGGFTLIELLAAMIFMAIVIPAALQGLQIASRAGEVAQRKAAATRILDSVMNENIAGAASRGATQKGVVSEGALDFNWQIRLENWKEDSMRLVTGDVTYQVRGQDYHVTA